MADDDRPGEDPAAQDAAHEAGDTSHGQPAARTTRRGGAMLGAAMLGLDIALGRKPREEIPVVVDADGEPVDVDADGITVPIDDAAAAVAPALPRRAPTPPQRRRRRGR